MNYPCKAFSVSLSSPALTVSQYTSSDWSLADTEYDRVRRALDEDFLPETLLKHGMLCMTCILTERVIRGPNGFLIFCCILLPYCYHIVTIHLAHLPGRLSVLADVKAQGWFAIHPFIHLNWTPVSKQVEDIPFRSHIQWNVVR